VRTDANTVARSGATPRQTADACKHVGPDMTRISPRKRESLVLAASGGGHLDLLLRIAPDLDAAERCWVTVDDSRARDLRDSGERVYTLPPLDQDHPSVRNPIVGLRLAARLRPRTIVTSGAGVVLPFAAVARALGSRLLFVETMARVSGPSLSGRFFGRLAERVFVQWPELVASYPGATVCRPALLEPLGGDGGRGRGTFVAVGTHPEPFDRLLEMVDAAAGAKLLPEPIVVQSGPSSYQARHIRLRPWVTREEYLAAIAEAQYVIGHAGSGLVGAALRAGRKPLVLPRGGRNEHVDDHQTQLADKLGQLGLAVRLVDAISATELASADAGLPEVDPFGGAPQLGAAIATGVA
jgi:UDP-N-acetylglucosamine--N-acetylmuramyl-(pentapeptide) pyrophosphoryl-undecaprenol N-acetylglucosamine transferase